APPRGEGPLGGSFLAGDEEVAPPNVPRHPRPADFALPELCRTRDSAGNQRLGGRGHEETVDHAVTEEATHVETRPLERGAVRQNPAVQVPGIGYRRRSFGRVH